MSTTVEELVKDVVVPSPRVQVPDCLRRPILVRPKMLMGSGPTNFSQRVIEALSKPLMGIYSDEMYQV